MQLKITRFHGVRNFETPTFEGANNIEADLNHMSDLKNENNIAT